VTSFRFTLLSVCIRPSPVSFDHTARDLATQQSNLDPLLLHQPRPQTTLTSSITIVRQTHNTAQILHQPWLSPTVSPSRSSTSSCKPYHLSSRRKRRVLSLSLCFRIDADQLAPGPYGYCLSECLLNEQFRGLVGIQHLLGRRTGRHLPFRKGDLGHPVLLCQLCLVTRESFSVADLQAGGLMYHTDASVITVCVHLFPLTPYHLTSLHITLSA
jgi:hypothetical protein